MPSAPPASTVPNHCHPQRSEGSQAIHTSRSPGQSRLFVYSLTCAGRHSGQRTLSYHLLQRTPAGVGQTYLGNYYETDYDFRFAFANRKLAQAPMGHGSSRRPSLL